MSQDTTFLQSADAVLAAIGTALDAALAASDADIDWSLNDGILEIDCGDDGKLIVNRHGVNREIWVAARSGGFHFRAEGGVWRDTRARQTLDITLSRLLREQADLAIDLSGLPPAAT
jgi:CyaY protein